MLQHPRALESLAALLAMVVSRRVERCVFLEREKDPGRQPRRVAALGQRQRFIRRCYRWFCTPYAP